MFYNLRQKRGKCLKLVTLTSFCQCTWQVVTLTMLNLLIEWLSVWQTKTCLIRQPIDEFTELYFFSAVSPYFTNPHFWYPIIYHIAAISNNPFVVIYILFTKCHWFQNCCNRKYVLLTSCFQRKTTYLWLFLWKCFALLLMFFFLLSWQHAYLSYSQHPRFKNVPFGFSYDAIAIEFLKFLFLSSFWPANSTLVQVFSNIGLIYTLLSTTPLIMDLEHITISPSRIPFPFLGQRA